LVNDESLKDTLLDLHNYSALALLLLNEEEKEKENPFPNWSAQLDSEF
jgi:hypothetical protein